MRVDQAPEGGKFRAVAASGLDGTAGAWGEADLLNVQIDASGEIALGDATNVDGVIWTLEGRKVDVTNNNQVIGGRKYTVYTWAELVEADLAASPALAAGDDLYAAAAGDVTTTPGAGAIYIGSVMSDQGRLVLRVNGRPAN